MDALLDASVQLIQVALLLLVAMQNFSIRARLKKIEEKLGSSPK